MFPLRDSIPSSRPPVVNVLLIAACTVVFVFELSLGPYLERFLRAYAFVPVRLFNPAAFDVNLLFNARSALLSMFLHGGWLHLIGNMWFLWIFGDNVEDVLGHGTYLLFYLGCGGAAALAQAFLAPTSGVPMVGASGAIMGLVGVAAAYAALRITRKTVFLTGLDLSFPGGKTHANGSPHCLAMLAESTRLDPVGQAGYSALAGRRLLYLPDKNGRMILTDLVLSSYRDSLSGELSASSERVLDCGQSGLPLGVRAIRGEQFEGLLGNTPAAGQRLHIDRERRFPEDQLSGFVAAERALLAEIADAAAVFAASGGQGGSLGALLADADYTWVHFPDLPDFSALDPGFVARARIAALYYAERLRRIESVL
jgi:membrane associated rhomboid family serine protease